MKYVKHAWWKHVLCFFGIHWEGRGNLGMYGDAGCCHICGAEAYGLIIVHDKAKKP